MKRKSKRRVRLLPARPPRPARSTRARDRTYWIWDVVSNPTPPNSSWGYWIPDASDPNNVWSLPIGHPDWTGWGPPAWPDDGDPWE
ncbi:hypothetical protein C8R43DRAFT_1120748 [Mycena crocata]|nr:hypothetical protein C8R43DRAFT_1120748 [Mycena crocata]